MKKNFLFLMMIFACLLLTGGVFAQTDEMTLVGSVEPDSFVSRMVWDETGEWITVVAHDQYRQFYAGPEGPADGSSAGTGFDFAAKDFTLTSVGNSGVMAALSGDRRTIFVYEEPADSEKAVKTIEPGFMMLSVSVSKDGSMVLADSADEIRTVVYKTTDGGQIYDLSGFSTAAPVYDSALSADGSHVVWHSRGTFAVQDAETGSFGETISLWDFASSWDLAPDNNVLAVGIINDDYESGAVLFFDPKTGDEIGRALVGEMAPHELSYSADGSVLMAADQKTLFRIDPRSFELQEQEEIVSADAGDLRISSVAPSPDGTSCAVLLSDGNLYLVRN